MENIFQEIKAERAAQDAQWGGPAHDDLLTESNFAGCIDYQLTKLEFVGNARERFIKIAALAVAAIESLDRREQPEPTTCPTNKTQ